MSFLHGVGPYSTHPSRCSLQCPFFMEWDHIVLQYLGFSCSSFSDKVSMLDQIPCASILSYRSTFFSALWIHAQFSGDQVTHFVENVWVQYHG